MDINDQTYQFKGNHFIASYLDCDRQSLTSIEGLRKAMEKAVKESGATILIQVDHVFESNGYTSAIILSESHATIHTYPEFQKCFVDLFTCGDKCSSERFDQVMRDYLKPKKVNYNLIKRSDNMQTSKL